MQNMKMTSNDDGWCNYILTFFSLVFLSDSAFTYFSLRFRRPCLRERFSCSAAVVVVIFYRRADGRKREKHEEKKKVSTITSWVNVTSFPYWCLSCPCSWIETSELFIHSWRQKTNFRDSSARSRSSHVVLFFVLIFTQSLVSTIDLVIFVLCLFVGIRAWRPTSSHVSRPTLSRKSKVLIVFLPGRF